MGLKVAGEDGGWDPEGFRQFMIGHFPVSFPEGYFDDDFADVEELENRALRKIIEALKNKLVSENSKVSTKTLMETPRLPAHEAIRNIMIRKIDQLWQEHLLRMDHLRSDVNLRTVGQRDPLMEFKHDAFVFFEEFSRTLRTEVAQDLFRFEIIMRAPPNLQEMLASLQLEATRSFVPEMDQILPQQISTNQEEVNSMAEEPRSEKQQTLFANAKPGRNDTCSCGSGKKYKKCCGIHSEDNS